jgi:hypothetical protein
VLAGARAKLRAYNAFLQGSFVTASCVMGRDLNSVLGEAWAGVEMRTSSGWALQYLVRWESPEWSRARARARSCGAASRSPRRFADPEQSAPSQGHQAVTSGTTHGLRSVLSEYRRLTGRTLTREKCTVHRRTLVPRGRDSYISCSHTNEATAST